MLWDGPPARPRPQRQGPDHALGPLSEPPDREGQGLRQTDRQVRRGIALSLWVFHNKVSGWCFPGYETIAEAAGCSRATVATAIKALEGEGLLTWVNRIKRVREPCPDLLGADGWRWRVLRTSNGYSFNDPLHTTRAAGYEGACPENTSISPASVSDGSSPLGERGVEAKEPIGYARATAARG